MEDNRTELTANRFRHEAQRFATVAGEEIGVQFMDGALYVFGSELATLRILMLYRSNQNARHGFSKNLQTHFFCLETPMLKGSYDTIQAKPY